MTANSLFPDLELFDVHSHLLPGVDDGCATLEDSLLCARRMVEAGYSQSFCTPHFWPNYPNITVESIPKWVGQFQTQLDQAGIALKLYPGGEINLHPKLMQMNIKSLPTFGMKRKYLLCDIWADRLPDWFEPTIRWMQSDGLTVILAHPERMRAVQEQPELADYFAELGILLQGNLQCFGEPTDTWMRITAERYLEEDRYFMLGSDLHNSQILPVRFRGLRRAAEAVGAEKLKILMRNNPMKLLE